MQDSTALAFVSQLPKIEENLRQFGLEVQEKVNFAKALVCTEDSLVAVKNQRAELKKEFTQLEEQRKAIKKQIMAPYEEFNDIYENNVAKVFKEADSILKSKVDETENELKERTAEALRSYYAEYCASAGVDFVPFDRVVPSVNRSVTVKKYKENIRAFIDKVVDDIGLIKIQEHPEEIMFEYKKTLNVSESIRIVIERHKAIEEEKEKAKQEPAKEEAAAPVIVAPAVSAPVVEDEKIYEITFTVKGTKSELKRLKKFLTDGGYTYE